MPSISFLTSRDIVVSCQIFWVSGDIYLAPFIIVNPKVFTNGSTILLIQGEVSIPNVLILTKKVGFKVTLADQGGINPKPLYSPIQHSDKDIIDSSQDVLLEQVQSNPYNLSYTCFLIPRNPSQQLIGELVDALPRWLTEICTSFGWKLEFVKVTPDYFQWALSVLPAVPTGNILQQVRSQTSELILANYINFKEDGAFDGFWATGYLILSGVQSDPKEIIDRYIQIIHKQQHH
jgi:REP element-mobilizing transposase RayT